MALSHPTPIFTTPLTLKQAAKPALSQASKSQKSHPHLTPPDAIIATPLLNPETDTGVYLLVVELSPTCASEKKSRQLETRVSRTQQTALPKPRQEASLGRMRCVPSSTPHRCWSTHRNDPANHASPGNDPTHTPPTKRVFKTHTPASQQHNKSSRH